MAMLDWIAGPPDALARHATGWDRLIIVALLAACGLLWLGLTLPILKTSRLLIFSDEISLTRMVVELWTDREIFLSLAIAVFSVAFPAIKLAAAYGLWRHVSMGSARFTRLIAFVDFLGKWSLADVLIVALAIVVVKSSGFMDARMGIGLYPFAASIVLTAVVVARLKRLAKRHGTA